MRRIVECSYWYINHNVHYEKYATGHNPVCSLYYAALNIKYNGLSTYYRKKIPVSTSAYKVGFEVKGKKNKVYKLTKALYDLKSFLRV